MNQADHRADSATPGATSRDAGVAASPGDFSGVPADEPVFSAPWQATAFALTVRLHDQGHFAWSRWSELLGEEVARPPAAGSDGSDPADLYWRAWLAALERMVVERGLGEAQALGELAKAWHEAILATPHGEPVLLKR